MSKLYAKSLRFPWPTISLALPFSVLTHFIAHGFMGEEFPPENSYATCTVGVQQPFRVRGGTSLARLMFVLNMNSQL